MYTDEQKKRIAGMIEAFKGCRAYVVDSPGICAAITGWAIRHGYSTDFRSAHDARDLIKRALGESTYLEGWITRRNIGRCISYAEMLALRHRWLDQLIADCEAALKD